MVSVSAADLQYRTRDVLDAARHGETVVIEDDGQPAAALIPFSQHEQDEANVRELMTLRAFKHFIDAGWSSERAEEMAAQFVEYRDMISRLDTAATREDVSRISEQIVGLMPDTIIEYDIQLLQHDAGLNASVDTVLGDTATKIKHRLRLLRKVHMRAHSA
jgi:prevent-host-death family protein